MRIQTDHPTYETYRRFEQGPGDLYNRPERPERHIEDPDAPSFLDTLLDEIAKENSK